MNREEIIAELKKIWKSPKMCVMPPDMRFHWQEDKETGDFYLADLNKRMKDITFTDVQGG